MHQEDLLYIALPAAMLVAVAALLRIAPQVWSTMVGPDDLRRNHTMDGTRGLLSLWVLTHHVTTLPYILVNIPVPRSGDSVVTKLLASSFFIAPFYTLTAMLFGGSLVASKGRLDTIGFLSKRFLRLAPVYVLSVILVFAAAFLMAGFHLQVTPFKLIKTIVRWLSFGFIPVVDVNGEKVSSWHGMIWTLPAEIGFYLLLPILAWAQRKTHSPVVLILALGIISIFVWQFAFFTAGVLAAMATGWRHRRAPLVWTLLAIAAVIAISLTAATAGSLLQSIFLIPIAVAAAHQVNILRPLRARPIRFIGEMSYSIYIIHFPMICIAFTLLIDAKAIDALPMIQSALVFGSVGLFVLLISSLSFIFVERPIIGFGKRVFAGR